jgi:UDP-3-O-[3-hydroxymyristoyl] N-acetylglucosamine deacetylase
MEPFGICFRFDDDIYSVTDAKVVDSRRNTSIIFPGGQIVRMTEHLLASIVGLEIDDVLIEAAAGTELPILDGSALPFVLGLTEMGFAEKDEPAECLRLAAPICLESGESRIAAMPSDRLRVTYVIDYPNTAIGSEVKDVSVSRESFARDIAPARTFGLLSEAEALGRLGLAKGGNLDNVIVIGGEGPLNAGGYRMDRECSTHKILDLMGDLALLGTTIKAGFICIKSGHELHSRLVSRMKAFVQKIKGVTCDGRYGE